MKKYSHLFVLILFFAMILLLGGCGGSDSGDDSGGDSGEGGGGQDQNIVGLQFTEANMVDATLIGVDPLMLFPPFSEIIQAVNQVLENEENTSPFAFGEGFCQPGGQAVLTWDELAVGGTVNLGFNSCKHDDNIPELDGTITFQITEINDEATTPDPFLSVQINLNLTAADEVDGSPSTLFLKGNFLLRMYNMAGKIGFQYGGIDPDGAGALLSISEEENESQFGCFDVSLSFPLEGEEETFIMGDSNISNIYGIVVLDQQLLTVVSRQGGYDLVFEDYMPISGGGLNYFGLVLGNGCNVLGLPDGVGVGGDANMSLYPINGDGTMMLELFSNGFGPPPDVTQSIDWLSLID